ncbi:hypothetical protein Lalb_Chr19g0133651 [Lupinus albus]|uniref:Uncharacterized protein n=1 Tax=Lupinus albus TaxID=3870 RepID=A0A6A4NGQ6_LUPAL|nr:hypothetical protein Lalb_Chr19g0133651 [Lupinus albus]
MKWSFLYQNLCFFQFCCSTKKINHACIMIYGYFTAVFTSHVLKMFPTLLNKSSMTTCS